MKERKKLHHLSKDYKEAKEKGLIDSEGYLIETGEGQETTNPAENSQVNTEQKEASVPLSEVQAMMEKMKAELLSSIPQQPKVVQQSVQQAFAPVINDIDDIPELKNWERKARRYEICDGSPRSQSRSIHSRPSPQKALNYINKETNTQHPIRYATDQMSFFVEKQSKEVGSVHSPDIIFTFNMLNTHEDDILLQKFLHIHPDYGTIFREYNPTALADERIKVKKLRLKAENLVFNFGEIENRMIASLMCGSYVEAWDDQTIIDELLLEVEKNPQKYLDFTEDPTLKMKGIAKSAQNKGDLIYDNYRWMNNQRKVLVEVPKNKNEYDELVKYFEGEEGRTFLDYLRNS